MRMKTVIKVTILLVFSGLTASCSGDPLIIDKNWVPKRMVGYISQLEPGYYGSKLTRVVFKNGKEMVSSKKMKRKALMRTWII